jgi:hypothetical protein
LVGSTPRLNRWNGFSAKRRLRWWEALACRLKAQCLEPVLLRDIPAPRKAEVQHFLHCLSETAVIQETQPHQTNRVNNRLSQAIRGPIKFLVHWAHFQRRASHLLSRLVRLSGPKRLLESRRREKLSKLLNWFARLIKLPI